MTDIQSPAVTAPDNRTLGYVAAVLTFVFAPAGLILSYIDRGQATPLVASHYNYLIGTFWKGLLFMVISLILTFVVIGFLAYIATSIWYLARCIKSLVYLNRGEPIANPSTWLI